MARWQDYILRGTLAAQPSGSTVAIGTLYCITDQANLVQRWNGSSWDNYSPTASGNVAGPGSSTDKAIVRFNGTTGKIIQNSGITIADAATGALSGTNTGDVTLAGDNYITIAGQVITAAHVNLASQVTGLLPYANFTNASAASLLLGRGASGGAGTWQEITLGTGLSMAGTVLSSSGGGGGTVTQGTNGFRLTLASGQPVYAPQSATPTSTDTTNDFITMSTDPGWANGTIVTPSATGGGLTTLTKYFLHRISGTTYSFHTTVAAAMTGTSRVDLTASITAVILTSGISTTGLYMTPWLSNQVALYDGYTWHMMSLAEMSVGLTTLSANTNYDLFLDYNGGSPNLYIGTAWTSNTVRNVGLVRQDGVWVSSADAQSRYMGTLQTDSTTTTIDDRGGLFSQVGGRRYLWNAQNRVCRPMLVRDLSSSWTYGLATWRQANAATGNKNEYVIGLQSESCWGLYNCEVSGAGSTDACIGIGVDSTSATPLVSGFFGGSGSGNAVTELEFDVGIGYHFTAPLELSDVSTVTFSMNLAAGQRIGGLQGRVWC